MGHNIIHCHILSMCMRLISKWRTGFLRLNVTIMDPIHQVFAVLFVVLEVTEKFNYFWINDNNYYDVCLSL